VRILIVSQYFWPESFRINDLAEWFVERGHEATVLTGLPNYPEGAFFKGYGIIGPYREEHNGVEIIRTPLIPRRGGGGLMLALNYISFALSASVLGPIMVRGKFDAIFVFQTSPATVGFPAIVMKYLKKTPMFFWVLDLWPESLSAVGAVKSKGVLDLVARMVRFIYKRCDRVLVQSRGFIPNVSLLGAECKTLYFPSWAEDIYKPAPPQGDVTLPEGFKVMFAGSIGAAQSFETILSAAERLKDHKDIHWVVLGDGRMLPWVRDEVARRGLGNHVHLFGRRPVEAMPGFFAAADAMLVTLKKEPAFALTIPAKIQSYLACGRPVIAALDGEGARVVEEAEAGVACPAEDADALAKAVLSMRDMPREEREGMGRSGRVYYDKTFNRENLFKTLENWMLDMIKNPDSPKTP